MWESSSSRRLLIPHYTQDCSSVPVVDKATHVRDEGNTSDDPKGDEFLFFVGAVAHSFSRR
jgi:hypothetical protein